MRSEKIAENTLKMPFWGYRFSGMPVPNPKSLFEAGSSILGVSAHAQWKESRKTPLECRFVQNIPV